MIVRLFKQTSMPPAKVGRIDPIVGPEAAAIAVTVVKPRPQSAMTLSENAGQSKLWRGVANIYQRLFALSLAGIVVAGAGAPFTTARASEVPAPGHQDARLRNVYYDVNNVVLLNGGFRHALEIQFAANETVAQAALGDTVSWQIAPVSNVIFLKPREKAQGTNLIVITNGPLGTRTYHFQLTMGVGPVMYGVRFHYPRQEAETAQLIARVSEAQQSQSVESGVVKQALDHAVIEGARNFKYTVQGSSDLQPSEISDNGEFTVLRYPGHADIPSIFGVDPDGSEEIVPYDVRDDFVVIHAVYRQLRLRRGGLVLCIYNEAPPRNDRGARTGTVSNVVERQVKGQ